MWHLQVILFNIRNLDEIKKNRELCWQTEKK